MPSSLTRFAFVFQKPNDIPRLFPIDLTMAARSRWKEISGLSLIFARRPLPSDFKERVPDFVVPRRSFGSWSW